MRSIEWRRFQWPWMTPNPGNPHFKVTILFIFSKSNNSKVVQKRAILSYKCTAIVSRIWSIKRRHFQWPWTTSNQGLKVTPSWDAESPRNSTRYRHSYNGIIIRIYTCPAQRYISIDWSDFQWLSAIFSDTKHNTVSLRTSLVFVIIVVSPTYIVAGRCRWNTAPLWTRSPVGR